MNSIGAQLYTVREFLNTPEQAAQTLRQIKALGYDSVQLFGSEEKIRLHAAAAKDAGLSISGALADRKLCELMGDSLFDLWEEYGIPDIGVSAFVTEYEDAVAYIDWANAYARKAKERGLTFSYHNHAKEFVHTSVGKTVMQLYLESFDPEAVDFMPDTYWLQRGGCDVRHFLELTKGRVKLLHLKDMKYTGTEPQFAEVGSGNLWFEGILQTALDCGIHNFAVEQDKCDQDPMDSLRDSLQYIRQLGLL